MFFTTRNGDVQVRYVGPGRVPGGLSGSCEQRRRRVEAARAQADPWTAERHKVVPHRLPVMLVGS